MKCSNKQNVNSFELGFDLRFTVNDLVEILPNLNGTTNI